LAPHLAVGFGEACRIAAQDMEVSFLFSFSSLSRLLHTAINICWKSLGNMCPLG
jgi:hypothetical protein